MWIGKVADQPAWDIFLPDTDAAGRVWASEHVKQLGVRAGVRFELVLWLGTQAAVWFAEVKADGVIYQRIPGTFQTAEAARARLAGMNILNMQQMLTDMVQHG